MMRKTFTRSVLVVCVTVFILSCSNTWEGIKQDSKELGNSIGKAAENTGKTIQEATE